MRTREVSFVALTAMFLTTSVWAHTDSPTGGAQAEASNKKTSLKKGTNANSHGGSIKPTTPDRSAKSPRDPQSGLPTGQRLHKPVDQASPKLAATKTTDKASPNLAVTKPTDQASPKLALTKTTDKASPGLLKQGFATPLSASPTPAPAIKKGTTSKR